MINIFIFVKNLITHMVQVLFPDKIPVQQLKLKNNKFK